MSEIRANTISDAAGTGPIDLHKQSAAKAWVNFNGTGTVAIRDSMNVSSITDHEVGQYTTTFSTSMDTDGYSAPIGTYHRGGVTVDLCISYRSYSTGSVGVYTFTGSSVFDSPIVSIAIHGDLA